MCSFLFLLGHTPANAPRHTVPITHQYLHKSGLTSSHPSNTGPLSSAIVQPSSKQTGYYQTISPGHIQI